MSNMSHIENASKIFNMSCPIVFDPYGKPIPFFFTTAQKPFFTRFFRYFGINLVHFRNNSQKLPYSVWSLKCVFQMSLVWHQK